MIMKKSVLILICALVFTGTPAVWGPRAVSAVAPPVYVEPVRDQPETVQGQGPEAAGYRSGRGTYRGGPRSGIAPGVQPGARAPADRTARNPNEPAAPGGTAPYPNRGGGLGGFFGGMAAGTLLGSLFNPFGFGGYGYGGGGFSFIGLLFWGVLLYAGYRFFKRIRGRGHRENRR